jgi:cell division protein FtsB
MFKLKTLLLLSILPLAYLIYHLIGFENGINAYVHKIKKLKNKQIQQEELKKEINYYKTKILLLDEDNINIDFLEEKSYELGESPKNTFTVIIK